MYLLSEFCAKHKFSLYFFGGKEGVADRAALKLRRRNPSLKVVGVCHGYISDKSILLKDINDKAPNILIVCLGMWKQEKWIVENLGDLNVNVAFGNGGAFDFVSENIKRAPKFIQNIGFEWLYRLIKQPWRIKRQMVLPIFVFLVLHQWCRRKLKTIWSKIP
jgi:N-acetylglucosaminyldiphosphoundecaprenol N-acetyl-beta-D-mannosaminyltransferase